MPEEKQENKKIPALRTFKTEAGEYIRKENISLADIALEEAKRRRTTLSPNEKTKKLKKLLLITGGAAILGLGGFFIWQQLQKEPVVISQKPPQPIIISDQEKILAISSKSEFVSAIKKELEKNSLPRAAVRYLAFLQEKSPEIKEFLNSQSFLNLLEIFPPPDFSRTLTNRFYLGIFRKDANWPILIFEVDSFDSAFAGMLNWEKKLLKDLRLLIPQTLNIETEQTAFVDEIIKNQDVRLIRNTAHQPIILYSFFNQRFLIITFSQAALEKALERLNQSLPLN